MKLNAFIVMIILMFSCSGNNNIKTDQSQDSKELAPEIRAIIMKDYSDAIELLSIKHNISYDNSNKIVLEYIKIFDPIFQEIISGINDDRSGEKVFNPDETLTEFIKRMTLLTNESTEKISSFVIDLKMYMTIIKDND